MRALAEARDPFAVLLAVAAAVVLLVAQEGPVVALLAAASVPIVRVAAGAGARRWRPQPPPTPPTPSVPSGPWYLPLTKRESEVALLVADGLTNRQIADTLPSERSVDGHITDRSVDAHVQHIFDKLSKSLGKEVNRRTQITAWVVERRPRDPATKPK
jgi:DNA-binding NarL/FixJ family response regulator